MKNIFKLLLRFTLVICITLPTYAGKNKDIPSAQRLGLFILEAPNPVESQVPEQFFVQGQVPQSFLNGPKKLTGWKQYENKIIERVEADKKTKGLVPIAIIDTGMDPSNDFARQIMMWDVEDGKVVGAGRDFQSNNRWGFPHNRDPWMYVFGSQGIDENGRILSAVEDPIKQLDELNERIMAKLIEVVKNNPSLKNSFFTKINASNTNMIGLLRLVNYPINEEMLNELITKNKTLHPQMNPAALDVAEFSLLNFSKSAWIMLPDSGLPDFFSTYNLERLQGISEFKADVLKVMDSEDGRTLQKNVVNMRMYFEDHHFNLESPKRLVGAYTMAKLSQQIAFKKMGTQIHHPAFEFYLSIRQLKAKYPGLSWDQIVEKAIDTYTSLLRFMQMDRGTRRDRAAMATLESLIQSQEQIKKFVFSINEFKDIESILKYIETTGKIPWTIDSSLNRAFSIRTKHPGLHKNSQNEFHGTHVGTTSEAYLGNLARPIPYKVGLGVVKGNLVIQNNVIKKNIEAMAKWLEKPVVARAVYNTLTKESQLDIPIDIHTPYGIKQLAAFMTRRFESYLAKAASSGMVGQTLHWQLVEAVKDAVSRKIPFANLSLGGEFTHPSAHPTLDTADEKIGATLDFIFGEFQKYIVAEAMTTIGKNTLFFIAAGNSHNIGEGQTRTNYPADLRSKWLSAQKAAGEVLPGEHLENIVIVDSSNGQGRLSNFSNKILTDNDEFMIRGENIRAGAMSFTMATAETMIKARYPEIYRVQQHMKENIKPDDSRVASALEKLGIGMEEFDSLRMALEEAITMVKHTLKLQHNDQKAEISGTSMATPSVAALAMLEFSEKLLKADKFYWEVYGQTGFKPENIKTDLKKNSILIPIGNDRNQVPSLENRQRFLDPSKKELNLKGRLNKMRESNILCRRVYSK